MNKDYQEDVSFKIWRRLSICIASPESSVFLNLSCVSLAWLVFSHLFIVVGLLSLFLPPISSVGVAGEVFSPLTNEDKPSLLFAKVFRVFHSARLSVFLFKVAVSRQTFCGDFGLA